MAALTAAGSASRRHRGDRCAYPPIAQIKPGGNAGRLLTRRDIVCRRRRSGSTPATPARGRSRCYGDADDLLGGYAQYSRNADDQTGLALDKKPNDFSLFMHGNVWNWCQDRISLPVRREGRGRDADEQAIARPNRRARGAPSRAPHSSSLGPATFQCANLSGTSTSARRAMVGSP